MKNSRVSDVRIVKCPKCTKLLPEPANVPFYICGGCNTTLQAKYYKKADERGNTVSSGSGSLKINEGDSVSEPGHLRDEKPSESLINTGEALGDHGFVGKREDGRASSSNEPKEQVGQDEIVVEEEPLSANSSSEDASSETNTTKSEEKALSKLSQNDDVSSCRLEQDEVASMSREGLLSSGDSRRKTTIPVQTAEHEPKLGDEPGVGVGKLTSQLGSADGEVITQNIPSKHGKDQPEFGVSYESEASSRDEHVFSDGSSSQFPRSKQFGGVSSKIVTPSNDSAHCLTTEDKERDEASLQNDTGECEDNKIPDSPPSEANPSFPINSEKMDESALLTPEAAQRAGSDLSHEAEVSTPSGQDGKRESDQSFEADAPAYGNNRAPASSSSKTVSQTGVKAIPKEKTADLRQLLNSPARNSFASDGSVSSCDGNDNKLAHPIPSKTVKTCSPPTLQRQSDDLQTVSGGESFRSAAQSIPAMPEELKIPGGFSKDSHTRTRTMPRTRQVFPRTSLYRRSPDTSYESSTRASLVHSEIYDRPYISRDTESRIPRRIYTDPIWAKEELPVCPYHQSNERHQICCQGARTAYHVSDPHYRWAHHHGIRYVPREAFDSYTDSDYYTISEDQRQRDEDMIRLRSRRKSQHFQPIGGAAPFVTCYKCSELLQLPSDFLLFRGVRLHRVRCSACSAVLRYNLQKGRHLVPSTAGFSSELRRCVSTSTSAYAADSEKMSRRSSSSDCRQDKGKGVMAEAPGGPRVTWRRPSRTSPPLHQLMGYSSLSAVLDGRVAEDQETVAESTSR